MTLSYGYEKNENGITLTKLYGKADAIVTVPAFWQKQKVTAVGESLFRGEKQLKKLILAEGIVTSDWWAFGECPNLKEVILPQSFRQIGHRAFSGCTSLERIVLPESIEKIGEAAFWGCTSLTRISLPPKLERIRNRTFYGCSRLTDIDIPPSVERIELGAFEHCTRLSRLAIPDGVREIGSNTLGECSGLGKLDFPVSAAVISENLFSLRQLPPFEHGYIPNVELRLWEENAQKILALCYLTSAKRYAMAEREMYETYIREHEREMLFLAISLSDFQALSGLYDMGLPGEKDIDACIEEASALCRKEVVVSLQKYKQNRFGNCVTQHSAEALPFEKELLF
ncbi:MAG TPA: leucine-rich repeat domain-containing protein [Clostridiales bacterium]|nr:leucine-rich repeat domain-containing protein [Clostridiales bacterium]